MSRRFEDIAWQRAAIDATCSLFAGQPRSPGGPQRLTLTPARMLANLQRVQGTAGLPVSPELTLTAHARSAEDPFGGTPQFTVEMETGTGKTFVYLSTIRRLRQEFGFRKFVVVVPSVAVREGVLAAEATVREHLDRTWGADPLPTWVHSRRDLHRIRTFAEDPGSHCLILNIQALDKDANLLQRSHDDFAGRAPIELLADVRPVLLLDEPQRLDGPRSRAALASLAPLVTLRYSATHRTRHHRIVRFGPTEACDGGWVKRIEVDAVPGEAGAESVVRQQLRRTVEHHLERERAERERPADERCKVLSLVFLSRVAHYADEDGLARRAFVDAWRELTAGPFADLELPPIDRVHAGFFARDRRGAARDTSGRSAADADVYSLIAREQDRLLDRAEPLQVLFTHSALREGWDNPNVFQLCLLHPSTSTIRRRQEVGRGLRLPLRADGRRSRDPLRARLTVITHEAYEPFVRTLQAEIREETGDDFGGRIRDASRRRSVALRIDPGPLWALLAPRSRWSLGFSTDALVTAGASALRALPSGPPGRPPVELLQRALGLPRSSLLRMLEASGRADLGDPAPVLDALTATLRRERLRGLRYLDAPGLPHPPPPSVRPGFDEELHPVQRGVYTHAWCPTDRDHAVARALDARTDIRCFLRVPHDRSVPSPEGPLHPGWAALRTDGRGLVVDPEAEPHRSACLRAWAEARGLDYTEYPPST